MSGHRSEKLSKINFRHPKQILSKNFDGNVWLIVSREKKTQSRARSGIKLPVIFEPMTQKRFATFPLNSKHFLEKIFERFFKNLTGVEKANLGSLSFFSLQWSHKLLGHCAPHKFVNFVESALEF